MFCVLLLGDAAVLCAGCEFGQPCAIRSQPDNCWYRGQLVRVDEEHDEFEVLLVDVGRNEVTTREHLRLLQCDLLAHPVSLLRLSTQFSNRQGNAATMCLSICQLLSSLFCWSLVDDSQHDVAVRHSLLLFSLPCAM